MSISRLSPRLIVALLIAVAFAISLLFRVVLPYDQVFSGEWVKYTSVDAYFHMRLVDSMVHNFPHTMGFDPFFLYPSNYHPPFIFSDWLLAGIIWLFGLGSPTQNIINVISVLFPAMVAALTVIPVYFIGKALFNRWVGVLAAFLMAILPGEYLGRTILGLNDTPGSETLLTTTFIAFLIWAIKTAREKELSFDHIWKWDSTKCVRPLVLSVLAGVFLGLYLISWGGALLFVFISGLYLAVRFIKDHLAQRSVDYLGIVGIVSLLIALIIYSPMSLSSFYVLILVLALLIPVVFVVVSRLMTYKNISPYFYPVALVVIAGIAAAIFYGIKPELFRSIFARFDIFAPSGATATTTIEMQPFLAPLGNFTTAIGWGNFTTSFFLFSKFAFPGVALISLSILIYLFIRRKSLSQGYLRPVIWTLMVLVIIMVTLLMSGYGHRYWSLVFSAVLVALLFIPGDEQKPWALFIIWTLVILTLTLGQRRFAYYFVVNVALLSAYLCYQVVWLVGLRRLTAGPQETPVAVPEVKQKDRKKSPRRERRGISIYVINTAVASLALFFLVFFPNIVKATEMTTAEEAPYAPTDAWMSSLLWMKDNTPDPMGDPDAYYHLYDAPPPGESFHYPASAYGVTSWWDYGYWITRIAHRIPSANPGQNPDRIMNVANLFLSRDDESSRALLEKMGTSYIIIDNLTVGSKYWAVITWAGQQERQYYDVFLLPIEGKLQPVQFFLPDYYQTLAVRLFNFDGKAVSDVRAAVITYTEKREQGFSYKQVTAAKEFTSYQEARDYYDSLTSGNNLIVGVSPYISPVPLEAVPDFQLAYSSEQGTSQQNVGFVPEVKIFEYTGRNK